MVLWGMLRRTLPVKFFPRNKTVNVNCRKRNSMRKKIKFHLLNEIYLKMYPKTLMMFSHTVCIRVYIKKIGENVFSPISALAHFTTNKVPSNIFTVLFFINEVSLLFSIIQDQMRGCLRVSCELLPNWLPLLKNQVPLLC